jgi:hypothetical protein
MGLPMTAVERIRKWQGQKPSTATLSFFQGTNKRWYVTAVGKGPVTFELTGEDIEIEAAAAKLIRQLEMIGEKVPTA